MNMYQKRKMRAEKKNNNQETVSKNKISWYKPTLINFQVDLDFIRLFI